MLAAAKAIAGSRPVKYRKILYSPDDFWGTYCTVGTTKYVMDNSTLELWTTGTNGTNLPPLDWYLCGYGCAWATAGVTTIRVGVPVAYEDAPLYLYRTYNNQNSTERLYVKDIQ